MKIIADLHIHSPYSRAVSKAMTLPNLDYYARLKGINILGTGDFTHPKWFNELKNKLIKAEEGLYRLNPEFKINDEVYDKKAEVRFMLTVELSSIYKKGNRVRRIHTLIFVSSLESVEKINLVLGKRGNIVSDGRPILGLDPKEILKIVLDIDERALIVPAHAWTPWFAIFGSMSGFDSIEECFDEYSKYIYAIETGLSSDPEMNANVPALKNIALLSNSDSHSLLRIGREANVFNTELSFGSIRSAIIKNDLEKFPYTIEFFPEEGRYHIDGHRVCDFSCLPEETEKNNGICPKCERPLTVGVLNRISKLSKKGKKKFRPFKRLVPLDEILSECFRVSKSSKKVKFEYNRILREVGTELDLLCELSDTELVKKLDPLICEAIMRVRKERLKISPGFDGEYGHVSIFTDEEAKEIKNKNLSFVLRDSPVLFQ